MILANYFGQFLMRVLRPTAPRDLPVPCTVKTLHRLAIVLADRNPAKGKVPAACKIGWHYDADVAQSLVDERKIITTSLRIDPEKYARAQWGVVVKNGAIYQDNGSNADLIWVATMPVSRAAKPVLFFQDPQDSGPKILDGSHRLIRAVIDGKTTLDVRVVGQQDVQCFLRPD